MGKKISFIGSGNVATQIAIALDRSGYTIHQIISRHKENAFKLAKKFGSFHSDKLDQLYSDIDFLIIAVSDDEIEKVASRIDLLNTTVVHTSGSVPIDVVSETSNSFGVFYPLQSFSGGASIDMNSVPILIEGSDEMALRNLDELAFKISNRILPTTSIDRRKIHLAAVMVNNFTNHLFAKADQYLKQNNLPFDILLPLILETVKKLNDLSPHEAQTGPARRGDHDTINMHLEMLKDDDELARLYALMSKMIEEKYIQE